jgi:hypothetical protein
MQPLCYRRKCLIDGDGRGMARLIPSWLRRRQGELNTEIKA